MIGLGVLSSAVVCLCSLWFFSMAAVSAAKAADCVYNVEIIDVSSQAVSLSAADNVRVQLTVNSPDDVNIIRFASNFGLTLCFEGGRAFLPNATPDFF